MPRKQDRMPPGVWRGHYTRLRRERKGGNMYSDFRRDMLIDLAEAGIDSQIIGQVISVMDMVATRYTIARTTQEIAVRGRDKLEEAAKLYLVCKKIEGCAAGTLDNYGRHIKSFVQYCSCPLEEIDANVLRKYLLLYKMDHNVSDRSLDKLRQDLQSWFVWMQNEGYIAKNPMANVAKIKYVVDQKPALTPMELERLREVCEDDRDRCLVEVLYSTGCRITEAPSLSARCSAKARNTGSFTFPRGPSRRSGSIWPPDVTAVSGCFVMTGEADRCSGRTPRSVFVSCASWLALARKRSPRTRCGIHSAPMPARLCPFRWCRRCWDIPKLTRP